MKREEIEQLRQVKTLPSLIKYLRDELEWPIGPDAVEDDVTFTYSAEELGLEPEYEDIVKEIKQIRPFDSKQPWGIFWINFDKKRLPVVILRRILGHLGVKRRGGKKSAKQASWDKHDLLFISAYGEDHDRAVTFAHFSQNPDSQDDLPALKVLGWDDSDTIPHLADAHETLKEKLRWPSDPGDVEAWRKEWSSAFVLGHREVIDTTEKLVEELARLAQTIYKRAHTAIKREAAKGPLRRLLAAFKESLIHDLDEKNFADVIAQTISYGLLTARFSCEEDITVQNLVDMVPRTNPFLRELLGTFLHIAGRRHLFDFDELGIQDVVDLLNHANIKAVKNDFGNRARGEDPVIHFYEHFLSAYNKEQKIQRGVFYTPQPVVSYIVRSVHELLQTEFGLDDGLASTVTWREMVKRNKRLEIPEGVEPDSAFVQILDPATGTATFLVEVIDVVYKAMVSKWQIEGMSEKQRLNAWNEYVPEHLLPRLHGYELMMAPYAIAHMKIGLKLIETGYKFASDERARIYLTNTLEPSQDFPDRFAFEVPALAHEAQAVNAIKRRQLFTVIVGNPPYSHRANLLSPEQRAIIEPYKFINGQRMRVRGALQLERNLNDDYVKFIRFAQTLIERSKIGIVGLITNNAYLENITFPGMRNSLASSFNFIEIVNLHGSAKMGGATPDGKKDENVFDIQQGVAISIFSLRPFKIDKQRRYCDVWGVRLEKERYLQQERREIIFQQFSCQPETFLFIPSGGKEALEYLKWKALDSIFGALGTGVMTNRNGLTIGMTSRELMRAIQLFSDQRLDDKTVSEQLGVNSNALWNLRSARAEIRKLDSSDFIRPIDFRVFDTQVIFYHPAAVDNMRRGFMEGVLKKGNLVLVTSRQQFKQGFRHVFVTRRIFDECFLSVASREKSSGFPLLGGGNPSEELSLSCDEINIKQSFLSELKSGNLSDARMKFNYIYAILHSELYRMRYADELKRGYPRIPETNNLPLIKSLARFGDELIALHLMESSRLVDPNTEFVGGKTARVEKVSWSDDFVWIDKDQSIGFKGVPERIWNFQIGGHQVCEKWLKDRKGRKLSKDDIDHYQRIVVALSETIRIMAEIDKVIDSHGGWPDAFSQKKSGK